MALWHTSCSHVNHCLSVQLLSAFSRLNHRSLSRAPRRFTFLTSLAFVALLGDLARPNIDCSLQFFVKCCCLMVSVILVCLNVELLNFNSRSAAIVRYNIFILSLKFVQVALSFLLLLARSNIIEVTLLCSSSWCALRKHLFLLAFIVVLNNKIDIWFRQSMIFNNDNLLCHSAALIFGLCLSGIA